jgi:hypothetical protein
LSSTWEHLNAWNVAIRDEIYGLDRAGQNVYLDLDEEVMGRILNHPLVAGKTKEDLFNDVLGIINFRAPKELVLESLRIQSRDWVFRAIESRDVNDVPPMLAFLAVTVAAAEEMGARDVDANAFYPHLCRLLKIDGTSVEANKLQASYRLVAEALWSYLNRWLVDIGYRRGVPTAYAITQRYVGIPVSQALVRETDRKRLPTMFHFFGLRPDNQISATEMEELVSLWISRDEYSVSAAVRRLWLDHQAREQICLAFCEELSNWNGMNAVIEGSLERTIHNRKLSLSAWFSNTMGVKEIELGLLAPSSYTQNNEMQELRHSDGQKVTFERLNENYFEAQNLSASSQQAILNSMLVLQDENGQIFRREPSALIALTFDEQVSGFVETRRVSAGQDVLLLVKDHKNLLLETKAFLDRNSRPGYEVLEPGVKGVPDGWRLFRKVQIVEIDNQLRTKIEKDTFSPLIPTAAPQLIVSGGVKLPGYRSLSQWLTAAPPELRALSQTSTKIKVVIETSDEISGSNLVIREIESEVGLIVQNLGELNLTTGNYLAVLYEAGKPVLSRRFTLASGEEPDLLLRSNAERLARDFSKDGSLAVFSATKTASTTGIVLGAFANHRSAEKTTKATFSRPQEWSGEEPASSFGNLELSLDELDANSCFYRGDHHWQGPTYRPHATIPASDVYACIKCNRLSVQNQSARDAEKAKELRMFAAVRNTRSGVMHSMPALSNGETAAFDWSLLRSILNYSVGGKYQALIDSVKQLGEEEHTASEIVQFLEQLGHLEVERDSHGKGLYWRLTETQIVRPNSDLDEFYILGATPKSFVDSMLENLKISGFSVGVDFSGILAKFSGVTLSAIKKVCKKLDVTFIDAPSGSLTSALPPFSQYSKEAAREVLPASDSISLFDLSTGIWKDAEAVTTGAIRLKTKFGMQYFFVASGSELEQGKGISCSATVAKYLAANSEGICLLSYGKEKSTIYVPLGAKLPGVYARPALLSNPQMPRRAKMSRPDGSTYHAYKYTNVNESIAQKLANLLAG